MQDTLRLDEKHAACETSSVHVVSVKPGMIRLGVDAGPVKPAGIESEIQVTVSEMNAYYEKNRQEATGLLQIRNLLQCRLGIAQRGLMEARRLAPTQPETASILMEKIQEDLGMLQNRIRRELNRLPQMRN